MKSGDAIARAVRALLMIDAALHSLVVADIYNAEVNPFHDEDDDSFGGAFDLSQADPEFLELINLLNESSSKEDYEDEESVKRLINNLEEYRKTHSSKPTQQLWFMLLDMIQVSYHQMSLLQIKYFSDFTKTLLHLYYKHNL